MMSGGRRSTLASAVARAAGARRRARPRPGRLRPVGLGVVRRARGLGRRDGGSGVTRPPPLAHRLGVAHVRGGAARLGGPLVAVVGPPRPDRARDAPNHRLRGRRPGSGRARAARSREAPAAHDPRCDHRCRRLRARALPDRDTHARPVRGTLLAQPLGYANALGALAAIGVVLGVGLVAEAPPGLARASIAATVPLLATALPLTQSRGAVVALGIGLVTTAACADDAAPLVVPRSSSPPAQSRAAIAAATSRLSDGNATPYAHAAWVVGAIAIVCAAATAVVAARVLSTPRSRRRVPAARARGERLTVALVAAVPGVGMPQSLAPPSGASRGISSNRHVAFGSGAGTFALAWARSGLSRRAAEPSTHIRSTSRRSPSSASSGLVLLLAFLALPLTRLRTNRARTGRGRGVRRLPRARRPRLGLGDARGRARGPLLRRGGCSPARAQPRPVTPAGARSDRRSRDSRWAHSRSRVRAVRRSRVCRRRDQSRSCLAPESPCVP